MRRRPNTPRGTARALIVIAAIMLTSVVMPLGVGTAAGTVAKPSGAAAPMGSVPFGTYRIQNRRSGNCLDHFTDGTGPYGNWVGMFTCNSSPSEKWQLISSGNPAYPYLFKNLDSQWCLTAPGFIAQSGYYYYADICDSFDVYQTFETQVATRGGTFILLLNDPTGDGDILVDEHQATCCFNGSPVGNFGFTNDPLQRWNFIAV
jgi:ricin-type beta-trefoil lectin protein